MLNFTKMFKATAPTILTRDNYFTIETPKGSLENKTFSSIVKVLLKDGKILNAPMRTTAVIEFNSVDKVFSISAATTNRGAIIIKVPVTDGVVDPLNITITSDEGNLNLMRAAAHSPLTMLLLNVLLPGAIVANWNTYLRMESDAIAKEVKDDKVTALRAERDEVLKELSRAPNAAATIRASYRNQIKLVELS